MEGIILNPPVPPGMEGIIDIEIPTYFHEDGTLYHYVYSEGDVVIKGETTINDQNGPFEIEIDIKLSEGWNCLAETEDVSGDSYILKSETPLDDSIWFFDSSDFPYTVTFDRNGGSPVEPMNVYYGGTVTRPVDPTRTGYTFGGWYTDNGTFADEWIFASDIITASITLYAKWTPIGGSEDNLVISGDLYTMISNNPLEEAVYEKFPANYSGTISMGMRTASTQEKGVRHLSAKI